MQIMTGEIKEHLESMNNDPEWIKINESDLTDKEKELKAVDLRSNTKLAKLARKERKKLKLKIPSKKRKTKCQQKH